MKAQRGAGYGVVSYVVMAVVGVLILVGAVLLVRALSGGSDAPSSQPASTGASAGLLCSDSEWLDASNGVCAPKATCLPEETYDPATNRCLTPSAAVTAVDPRTGPADGGTAITITGSGFKEGATVTIGGLPVNETTVVDDTTITGVTSGSEDLFPLDIQVANPDSDPVTLDNAFVYVAPEVERITEINPPTGSQKGGEAVIIKGVDFVEGVVVSFFGRPATDVIVLDPNTLRVTTPAGPLGPVNVNVRNPGEETYTDTEGFEYVDTPPRAVTAVRPAKGAGAGGTKVTIRGTGFADGATVTFGGSPARKVKVVSSTKITAVTPPGQLGEVPVGVRNPGLPVALLDGAFTYVSAPTITSIKPAKGPLEGGTTVTIKGTGFGPDAVVAVGNVILEDAKVVNKTTITIVMPPAVEPIKVDISVTNPGEPRALAKGAFTYVEAAPGPTSSAQPAP